jgi:signal peptidase II
LRETEKQPNERLREAENQPGERLREAEKEPSERPARWRDSALWLVALGFPPLLIFDQWTKWLAVKHLSDGHSVPILPFLQWTLAYNPGAAFSFLANAGGGQKYFFSALAIGISAYLVYWARQESLNKSLLSWALMLIITGAIGNLIDRLRIGKVIDFIDAFIGPHHWPIFNIADSCICIGGALLVIDAFRQSKR